MEFTRPDRLFRQFLLVTQMLSPIVLVLGIFRLMAKMGMVDQLPALVLAYVAFNLAFSVWMLQAYFQTIPRELEEAATLDGAIALPAAAAGLPAARLARDRHHGRLHLHLLLERIRAGDDAAALAGATTR